MSRKRSSAKKHARGANRTDDHGKRHLEAIEVLKADGRVEPFSSKKLRRSLRRSGAPDHLIEEVMRALSSRLSRMDAPVPTHRLHRLAFEQLRKQARLFAARYNLKQAIRALGPSGYPFEHFWARVLEAQGYETEVDKVLQGRCVSHEVDVIARRRGHTIVSECKFHHQRGAATDVKVALYIQARRLDLEQSTAPIHFDEFWLVTSTRFTLDAIAYGECVGLRLCAWDYPEHGNLQERIEADGLYPVTLLTTLSQTHKQALLERGIVLVKRVVEDPLLLKPLRLDKRREQRVLSEARALANPWRPPPNHD